MKSCDNSQKSCSDDATHHHNDVIFPAMLEISDSQTLKLNLVNVFVFFA